VKRELVERIVVKPLMTNGQTDKQTRLNALPTPSAILAAWVTSWWKRRILCMGCSSF